MSKKAFLSALLIALIVFGLLPLIASLQFSKAAQTTSTDALTGTVTELWNFTSSSEIVFSPVVADGCVYVKSGPSGGVYSILYCINASTGVQVWNKTGSVYRYTIANGYIYLSHGVSQGSAVSCLNAANGAQLWSYSYGTISGTPVVERGVVYVGGENWTWSTGISIGFIYALDAMTGRKIWSFSGPAGTNFYGSPVLADANLYAFSAAYSRQDASWHSAVYAFNAHTGKKLWNYTTPGRFSALTAAGQNVYVSSNFVDTNGNLDVENGSGYVYEGGVLALNALNGTRIWNYPIHSSVESPIVANDTVYAVSGVEDVYALAASDGKTIWNYSIGSGTTSPLLVDGYLYVGSSAGVHCFNASTGTLNWHFTDFFAGSWGVTIPAYTNGVIYAGWNAATYFFYALDALNGNRIWNYTIDGTVGYSPVVAGTMVFIGRDYAYPTDNPYMRGLGAVLALNSTITSLPHSTPFPFSTTLVVASVITVTVVSIGLLVYFKKRKR